MIDHLRRLRDERGIRLALLTNNVREWEARWRSMLPVDELFELVVDSAFVGMRKPEPGIYELTLERLGLPGEACAFVDDLEVNCDAARLHGIVPIRFETTEQAIRDLDAALDGAAAS
jgi:putative hydrolase of the HAD superfamily